MLSLFQLRAAQHGPQSASIGVDIPSPTPASPASAVATALASAVSSIVSSTVAAAASTSSSTPLPTSTPSGLSQQDGSEGECQLLGSFALVVQGALGALALLALVYKRYRERPQRPLLIWFFDVSKQVFGSVLVHVANIFMSMLTSGRFSIKLQPGAVQRRSDDAYVPNPCSFYLLNLAIDTTLGIPILILLLKIITALVALTPVGKPSESIQSGHYGSPPNVWWWLKQSVIYFCGLFGMKICVLIIFVFLPWISKVGDWALGWTEGNEKLQVAFVMMIFPLIMNALQYYIIDSFIKDKNVDHERLPSEEPDHRSRGAHTRPLQSQDDDSDADDNESDYDSRSRPLRSKALRGSLEEEYDPDLDGDASASTGHGAGQSRTEQGKVPPELYPKE